MGNSLRILLSVALLALCACNDGDSEKKSRGMHYMPEMYDTPAYKSQQAMEYTADDGKTRVQSPAMLSPPAGTVARGISTYDIPLTDIAAARALVNPLIADVAVLKRGQHGFITFCATCHGLDGNPEHGFVVGNKLRPNGLTGVAALNQSNLAAKSDGEIFHIITLGQRRMPNYRAQLPLADRWAVVIYVRELNRATIAQSDAEATLSQLESEKAEGGGRDNKAKDELDEKLESARRLVDQRKIDLDLIKKGGDGSEFAPSPASVPEYVKPKWPE